ncbi:hypothetical protein DPMN_004516 [Dreissena polymorpha]|uniref:Uncharacterized protein n=1 Tax=Dreissena polymorpha TaxID=45954 RepID=A0A9D4MMY9_DREPO|nr:hypothetical protein DPMN_004516 [Dreissena polymorpha]
MKTLSRYLVCRPQGTPISAARTPRDPSLVKSLLRTEFLGPQAPTSLQLQLPAPLLLATVAYTSPVEIPHSHNTVNG